MEILVSLLLMAITSFLIWKSGEGFEVASDYLGRNLSNGVKGATINAIGSSLPELLTTIFFLFIMRNSEGFASGLGTTAGSAVFNAVIIPFIVGITAFRMYKKSNFTFSRKVIIRDGLALLLVDVLLIIMVKGGIGSTKGLNWVEGLILMLFYLVYLGYLFFSMDKKELEHHEFVENVIEAKPKRTSKEFINAVLKLNFAEAFVGHHVIDNKRAWTLLIFSMLVMSLSCYWLAEASIMFGESINVPVYIVSIVIASAATSVPDTFLSYKDAKKGNYDDSISNAFGSNVFDIGFAVGFPVMLYGLIYGDIIIDGSVEKDISELLMLLLIITVVVFVTFLSSNKLSISKLVFLLLLYVVFILIVVGEIMNIPFVSEISEWLYNLSNYFIISTK